jgi:hypothetical protein
MRINNQFFLWHTQSEILILRSLIGFLNSGDEVLNNVQIACQSKRDYSESIIYLNDEGNSQRGIDEMGVHILDIFAKNVPDVVATFDYVLQQVTTFLSDGEVLTDCSNRTTIMGIKIRASGPTQKEWLRKAVHITYKTEPIESI